MSQDDDPLLALYRERARRARARAEANDARAQEAERLASEGGSPRLRETHRELRVLYRRVAQVHRQSAQRYLDLAKARRRDTVPVPGAQGENLLRAAESAFGGSTLGAVLLGTGGSLAELVGTDPVARGAVELELAFGEGPLHDAARTGLPLTVAADQLEQRWPGSGHFLTELGMSWVRALPLRHERTSFGALGLFNASTPPASEVTDQLVADVLTDVLLKEREDEAPLAGGQDLAEWAEPDMAAYHQAVGMVSGQLGCDLRTAAHVIGARAFTEGEGALAVARRIVAGDVDLRN